MQSAIAVTDLISACVTQLSVPYNAADRWRPHLRAGRTQVKTGSFFLVAAKIVSFSVNHMTFVVKVNKVKYVDLYSASSQSASNALPLPVSRRWSLQASPTARRSANTARPRIRVGVSRDMPVYCPSFHRVLISACPDGRLRLSRPMCLVLCQGVLPVHRRSPTKALTGPNVE